MANKINIQNYEAYLLDYMEGNLSKNDIAALRAFVVSHPELNIDLNELELVELYTERLKFDDKEGLKKSPSQLISEEQYVDFIENNLSAEEKNRITALRNLYPEVNKELSLYEKTIVRADTSIIFENKEQLKKETKIIRLFSRQTLSMAAAITLLIGFIALFRIFNTTTESHQFSDKKNDTLPANKTIPSVTTNSPANVTKKLLNTTTAIANKQTVINKTITRKKNNTSVVTQTINTPTSFTVSENPVTENKTNLTIPTLTTAVVSNETVKPSANPKAGSAYIITEKAYDEDENKIASNESSNFWQKAKKAVNGLNKIGVKTASTSEIKQENNEQYVLSLGNFSVEKNKYNQE